MCVNACEIHTSEFIPIDLILVAFEDVTDKKKWTDSLLELNEKLKVTNVELVKRSDQVRACSLALTEVEYRERKRFSYVLHENLQQILLGSKMLLRLHIEEHKQLDLPPEHDFEIKESLKLIEKALNITRSMSIELNPPILKTQGLDSALSWIASYMKDSYGLKVNLVVDPEVKNIKNETQLMLTQMVRELLFNVVKHSGVLEANVEATYQNKIIRVSVDDNGKGFNIETLRHKLEKGVKRGLFTIEERITLLGGNVELDSRPGEGTRCSIILPF
jgi:signal transduction histidine kinase